MAREKKVGDMVEAGELLLFTSGSYSDFGVNGIYRAKQPFVMPGRHSEWGSRGFVPDVAKVAADPALVEELDYAEVWGEN